LIVANLHADGTVFEDITYCDLAKGTTHLGGLRR